jgi:hypothetical protein
VPNDLEARRRSIIRAFRAGGRASERTDEIKLLQQTVTALSRRVDELTGELRALQHGAAIRSAPAFVASEEAHADEEPVAGRVSVPPITPARISNQAFDVLLGAVTEPSRSRVS